MNQIRTFNIDGIPTEGEIAEASLIAKHRKCQVNLRWFNHIVGSGAPVGDNVLEITEDMSYADCLAKLGCKPVKDVKYKR